MFEKLKAMINDCVFEETALEMVKETLEMIRNRSVEEPESDNWLLEEREKALVYSIKDGVTYLWEEECPIPPGKYVSYPLSSWEGAYLLFQDDKVNLQGGISLEEYYSKGGSQPLGFKIPGVHWYLFS